MKNLDNNNFLDTAIKNAPAPLSKRELGRKYGYLLEDMLNTNSGWEPKRKGIASAMAHAVFSLNEKTNTMRTMLTEGIRLIGSDANQLNPALAATRGIRNFDSSPENRIRFEKQGKKCKMQLTTKYSGSTLDMDVNLVDSAENPIRPFYLTIHDENEEELLWKKRFDDRSAVIRGLEPGEYQINATSHTGECEIRINVDR